LQRKSLSYERPPVAPTTTAGLALSPCSRGLPPDQPVTDGARGFFAWRAVSDHLRQGVNARAIGSPLCLRWLPRNERRGPRQPWANGCPCDYVGATSGVPQIAADLSRRPTRQPWARTGRKQLQQIAETIGLVLVRLPVLLRQATATQSIEILFQHALNASIWSTVNRLECCDRRLRI
jgi:hypothetical protein